MELKTKLIFEKVENGFIVRVQREGQNEEGEWEYSEKIYIADTAKKAQAIIEENTK